MSVSEPRSLFFSNLPSDGKRLEDAAHFELKEYRNFLKIARDYQRNEALIRIAWKADRTPGKDKSQWMELLPCPDRKHEPDATFREFLSIETEFVYESAPPAESGERRARQSFFREVHKIKVLRRDRTMRRLLLERTPLFPELAIKPNTYPLDKQIEAIDRLRSEPAEVHLPLLRLLQDRRFADRNWPELLTIDEPVWQVLTDESRDGTLEQREFVRRALATPDFAFLEGPPGSGKTTAICELILQVVNRGQRVLLSASTHVAVDNVLERIADGSHNEIIAVRIDRRDDEETPERVKGLRLEKFVESERQRLRAFHQVNPNPTLAQALFRRGLDSATDGERMVERLILEAANLVAGTTIGILQHPDLKSARRTKFAEPPFDMLIVDEASKTTFQEFLVPALWAKRWVLVGDPKQLSPYADEEDLAPNIRACVPQEWKREACLTVAEASEWNVAKEGKVLISITEPAQSDFLLRQAQASTAEHQLAFLSESGSIEDAATAMDLSEAAIIAGQKNDFQRLATAIPLDIARLSGPFADVWHRRRAAWLNYARIDSDEKMLWENEIAWRLALAYEMRSLPKQEQPQQYVQQMQRLLPIDNAHAVWDGVRQVYRLALPSVLESLMRGIGKRADARFETALTTGLDPAVYNSRSKRLGFQHRMHPDISSTPRRLFYEDQALQDAKGMARQRTWKCDCFGDHRAVWLEVDGREDGNRNEKEARELCKQLERFLAWTEKSPKTDGKPWEVAVLTFYRGQEAFIRDLLNNSQNMRTGYGAYARQTATHTTATIKLCTVDRFQGHEADVVLLSFVKTRSVGFLASPNRLNVALTRARYQLAMFGARQFFASDRCRSSFLRELATLPSNTPKN